MKFLIIFALGFLTSWNLKGNMGITPDNQMQLGLVSFPIPEVVQHSSAYVLTQMLNGTQRSQSATFLRTASQPIPAVPAVPMVTSARYILWRQRPRRGPRRCRRPIRSRLESLARSVTISPGWPGFPRHPGASPSGPDNGPTNPERFDMKKMFVLAAIVAVSFNYIRGNMASSDGHVQSAGFGLPSLGFGQVSDVVDRISVLVSGPSPAPVQGPVAIASVAPAQAMTASRQGSIRPVNAQYGSVAAGNTPSGNAPVGTANAGTTGQPMTKGVDLSNVPPELVRFMTPALLTTVPAGTQISAPLHNSRSSRSLPRLGRTPWHSASNSASRKRFGARSDGPGREDIKP